MLGREEEADRGPGIWKEAAAQWNGVSKSAMNLTPRKGLKRCSWTVLLGTTLLFCLPAICILFDRWAEHGYPSLIILLVSFIIFHGKSNPQSLFLCEGFLSGSSCLTELVQKIGPTSPPYQLNMEDFPFYILVTNSVRTRDRVQSNEARSMSTNLCCVWGFLKLFLFGDGGADEWKHDTDSRKTARVDRSTVQYCRTREGKGKWTRKAGEPKN